MRVALLHTAQVHVETFDQIFAELGVEVALDHHVDVALLDKARNQGIGAVRADVLHLLQDLSQADAVLCTCSTLGPIADEAAASIPNIIRVDRPLMERACAAGPQVLVALCLHSTRDATLDLLQGCAALAGRPVSPVVVMCAEAWAFFEAGDNDAYASSIAGAIKSKLAKETGVDCIILAQASMRVAEPLLQDISIPVLSSPILAAEKCIQVAQLTIPAVS